MKKILFRCAAIILLIIAVQVCISDQSQVTSDAKEDTFTIKASKEKIKKDKTFTLKIQIQSSAPIQNVNASLSYDCEQVEYLSGGGDAITGNSGVLTLNETFEKAVTSKTYKLTFQAVNLGKCQFELTNANYCRYEDLSVVSRGSSTENVEIIINDGIDDDCTLAELILGTGEMEEDWDSQTYDYHITVPKDTTIFAYSAVPSSDDSIVVSEGPDKLSDGPNIYTISVTAPSGDKAVYTLTVNR